MSSNFWICYARIVLHCTSLYINNNNNNNISNNNNSIEYMHFDIFAYQ